MKFTEDNNCASLAMHLVKTLHMIIVIAAVANLNQGHFTAELYEENNITR